MQMMASNEAQTNGYIPSNLEIKDLTEHFYTLSPISETNINMNAAANPDFAIAANIEEGPPLANMINENTKALPNNTIAIERGYGI